jgi:hypothetical protein
MGSKVLSINFRSKVDKLGSRLIIKLPQAASAKLPSRGQVAVSGSINGHDFKTVIEPDGNKGHWISVDGHMGQLKAGGHVEIEIEPVKDWPEPEVPADLKEALADDPEISEMWQDITPMARWEWVRWVNSTNNTDTRRRRVEVTIGKMHSGKRRPCCFNLAACTDPELSKNSKLLGIT